MLRAPDRAVAGVVWAVPLLLVASFGWLIADIVVVGAPLVSWTFLTSEPMDAGRAGGIGPIISATLLILAVCIAAAVPVGYGAAVLLAEYSGRTLFSRAVRRSMDVLAGVPSIVYGLFGNAFFGVALGLGFSILSGGLTLACMVLPVMIRTSEEGLRAVPNEIRLNAAALGISRTSTVFRLVVPAAAPALVAGLVLGIGRALAETAALIFTSGYVDRAPSSLSDSGRALSVHILDLAMNVPGGDPAAYASAFVLLLLLVVINTTAAALGASWQRFTLSRA